jgi:hypothetical protein
MIKKAWLRYYEKLPVRTYRARIIQSWDTAAKDSPNNNRYNFEAWRGLIV